jgi:Astacin (Peptidase family M12A).
MFVSQVAHSNRSFNVEAQMAHSPQLITCTPKQLPRSAWIPAAEQAIAVNPANRPQVEHLPMMGVAAAPTKESIAVMTKKYWHGGGVNLTVSFMDGAESALRKRILLHMNAWAKTANVTFRETTGTGQVRIARVADGYWSYLGTDILSIAHGDQTMNLEGFTMNTPESEFHRVVRHETGHTLGCPHEHMRKELVARVDPAKAYAFFLQTQGWDKPTVDAQVLTPLSAGSLIGTVHADEHSIMCYQLPGTITKDGQPIIGGLDIDKSDFDFMAKIYPKKLTKPTAAKKSTTRARTSTQTRTKAKRGGRTRRKTAAK